MLVWLDNPLYFRRGARGKIGEGGQAGHVGYGHRPMARTNEPQSRELAEGLLNSAFFGAYQAAKFTLRHGNPDVDALPVPAAMLCRECQ